MSYIQINIGGKDRPLKFNQMAVEVYAKNLNLEAIESSSIYATFFAGLVGGCYAKQEETDFKKTGFFLYFGMPMCLFTGTYRLTARK